MSHKTLVTTYSNVETAKKVIDDLTAGALAREDIGLAVNESTGEALLAVTTDADHIADAMEIIKNHKPNQVDTRETGWRQGGSFKDLHPDADQFTAVKLAEKRQEQSS